jgi:hypothetical protein
MPEELSLKIERFGPEARVFERAVRALARRGATHDLLDGTDHRLLAFEPVDPPRKMARARFADRFRATYFDYTNNRAVVAEGRLDAPEEATADLSAVQVPPSPQEFAAAVELVSEERALGAAIREGRLQSHEPMPPQVIAELPDGTVERTVTVGLLPLREDRRLRHEIVGVNMIRRRVERYEGGAPPTGQAGAGICGAPYSAGQPTASRGTAGQAWVSVYQGNTLLWRFLVVRPAASSGDLGLGRRPAVR